MPLPAVEKSEDRRAEFDCVRALLPRSNGRRGMSSVHPDDASDVQLSQCGPAVGVGGVGPLYP